MDPSLLSTFAAVERAHWWFLARREILLGILTRYIAPGAAVLDVGCGTGFVLEGLTPHYEAWGVDPSPLALALCRERGLTQVREGSATDLSSVATRRFDAALYLDVIEHLDDDAGALRAARSLLSPEGIVLVTVPAFPSLWSHHDEINEHRRRYRRRELVATLQRAGFAVHWASYFNCFLFPFAAADRILGRWIGRRTEDRLRVPPRPVNRLMQQLFLSERRRLAGVRPRGFPFGLSLVAVGRPERG